MRYTFAILATLLLAACGSQPPAPEQNPAGVEDRTPHTPVATPVQSGDIDPFSVAALKDPKNILSKRAIYFDYDSYVVKDEFKPLVEAHAKFLVNNPKFKVLIQGNADERGSREYNMALGQKRADAVKKAMAVLGAKADRIETISYGEDKPVAKGHDEASWAENRRVDVVVKSK